MEEPRNGAPTERDVQREVHPKHTPGPWRLDDVEHLLHRREILATTPNYHFIEGGNGSPKDGGLSLTGVMSDADARLIVAAPDLLDTSKAVLDFAAGNLDLFGLVELAKRSIARAEGRL